MSSEVYDIKIIVIPFKIYQCLASMRYQNASCCYQSSVLKKFERINEILPEIKFLTNPLNSNFLRKILHCDVAF